MDCKSCGRPLFDSGEERFICPYCGAEVVASECAAESTTVPSSANQGGKWTRAGLKERALALLSPGYWPLVLISLVAVVIGDYGGAFLRATLKFTTSTKTISSRAADMTGAFVPGGLSLDVQTVVVLLVLSVVLYVILVCNPIAVGVRKYFVGRHRGTARLRDLFFAFGSGHYWNIVLVFLMHDLVVLLWSLLLIVPGYVKAYGLRMVVYELADNPAISWRDAFAMSERVMRGQKWDAFLLDLSFILWWLLSSITRGVLDVLFVVPYYGLTLAGLYETLLGGKCAAERGDEAGQPANELEREMDAGRGKKLNWLWMAVLALALMRPSSTIYHTLVGLTWNTPLRHVFSSWDNIVLNIPLFSRGASSWVIQYVCPLPAWALLVVGAWWYVRRHLYGRKVLTYLLLGILLLMNVFMTRVVVQLVEAGSPEEIALMRQEAERLAKQCIGEDPATEAWAMAMAQGKAKAIGWDTSSSTINGNRFENKDFRLIGVVQEDGSVVTNTYISAYRVVEDNVVITNFTSRAQHTVDELIFTARAEEAVGSGSPDQAPRDEAEN